MSESTVDILNIFSDLLFNYNNNDLKHYDDYKKYA